MDLTQSLDGDDTGSDLDTPGPTETETALVTDVAYETESAGHRAEMPVFYVKCRFSDGSSRTVEVEGFRPSFLIPREDFATDTAGVLNDRRVLGVETNFDTEYWREAVGAPEATGEQIATALDDLGDADVVHDSEVREDIHNEDHVRVICRVPDDIANKSGRSEPLREEFSSTLEADVPFTRRFLIETEMYTGVEVPVGEERVRYENWANESSGEGLTQELEPAEAEPIDARLCIFDIEVATKGGGVPNPARARNPITAITAYDSHTEEYVVWGLEHDLWDDDNDIEAEVEQRVAEDYDFHVADVMLFDDETTMLDDFHEWFLDVDPDIATGWNSDGFDVPYLIQRSYNVSSLGILDWSVCGQPGVWTEDRGGEMTINHKLPGRSTLDLLEAYKKTQFRELDSYRLEDVAQAELGEGKEDIPPDKLDHAWAHEPVKFLTYNARDVQAVVEIEATVGLMGLYENLREVTGALYSTCNNNGPMLDTLFLRRAYEQGLALPTNTEPEEGKYHGAKVFETKPGVHEKCVYPDISSMYPSLFAMLNLGSETIIGDREDLEASEYTEDDVFKFPVDRRDFKVVPKGESYVVDRAENEDDYYLDDDEHFVDVDQYKGVKSSDGGVREMFDARYDDAFVLKPDVKESFIRDTIDELIELKYNYSGSMYAAVKRVTNCYSSDTNVLTEDGVRNIRDLEVGDMVYSINPESEEVTLKPVVETHAYPDYSGDLVEFENHYTDFRVTPNHKMLTRTQYEEYNGVEGYSFVEAGEIDSTSSAHWQPSDWDFDHSNPIDTIALTDFVDDHRVHAEHSVPGDEFRNQVNCSITYEGSFRAAYVLEPEDYQREKDTIDELSEDVLVSNGDEYARVPIEYDADNFIQLVGWYVTEGRTLTGNTGSEIVRITQCNDEQRGEITDLLEEMGIPYSVSTEKDVNISSAPLKQFFEDYCGTGSRQKKLPEFIFNASAAQKQLLFETLVKGDGSWSDKGKSYTTTSDELRDDILRLVTELGWNPRYESHVEDSWRIMFADQSNTIRGAEHSNRTQCSDGVYCVTVKDNHTLLAGRNGKFQFCGNSVYGVAGDSESGGKGFRLFNKDVAEGITLAGRQVITHTAETFTDYLRENYDPDAEVIGGDTDAAVTTIANADTFAEALEWAEEGIEHVEDSYDEFAKENYWIGEDDDNRLAVDLESLASTLFFMRDEDADNPDETGVRKRYAQHIVWDEDDGWLHEDIPELGAVTYGDYTDDGVLADRDPRGDVGITGFEYVRSDSAPITRDAQEQVLTDILLSSSPLDDIEPYVRDLVERARNGDFELAYLARPKGIGNPLDEYGWKEKAELDDDEITELVEEYGGKYVQTPSPTYRGAKYADDHFRWEELGPGTNPRKVPIAKVRSDEYPAAYQYESYPKGDYPEPPEVDDPVDAISMEHPDRLPSGFVVDYDEIVESELRDKLEQVLLTVGIEWDDMMGVGTQSGLDQWA